MWRLDFDYSNILRKSIAGQELLWLDAEYLRAELGASFGLPYDFEVGVAVPGFLYTGGFLDPVIDGFHNLLNWMKLPGGSTTVRRRTVDGQLRYEYLRDDVVVFQGDKATSSIGDITIEVKRQVLRHGPHSLSLRGLVKLPSGSVEQLSGSGTTDFGVGFAFDRLGSRLGIFLSANHYFLGSTDALPTRDYTAAMGGFDLRFMPRLWLVVQVDRMTPFLRSELQELGGRATQLSFGLRFLQSERFGYEWRFAEDLSRTAPDFSFGFQAVVRMNHVPTLW